MSSEMAAQARFELATPNSAAGSRFPDSPSSQGGSRLAGSPAGLEGGNAVIQLVKVPSIDSVLGML